MNRFFEDMKARGLVKDVSAPAQAGWPALHERFASGPVTGYVGFDPTAASLHVGSLLQVLTLVRLQRAGHRPIAVVGGGTGLIGDPSGKASERPMLGRERLEENLAGIRTQLERFLDFGGSNGAILADNCAWLGELKVIDFLRDIGKLFSVNQMMVRDSVAQRLRDREQGISFTEFSYALLQAYDFLHLYDEYHCELQLGGSDQWGNILDGVDLIRRVRRKPTWGMTAPLVRRADGTKFGKSEGRNIWLDPDLTSPYAFYQYWINTEDADTGRYLRFFTFLSMDEIAAIEQLVAKNPERREAQRVLADEVTRAVHGESVLHSVRRATATLFGGGELRKLTEVELRDAFADVPRTSIEAANLGTPNAEIVSLLVSAGLEPSRSRARAAIARGTIWLNNAPMTAAGRILGADDILPGGFAVLRRGKKSFHVVDVTG